MQENKRQKSLIGKVFKYLTVLEEAGRTNNGTVIYKCLCKCGNIHHASSNSLNQYVIKSCGCLKKEWIDSKPFKTHGMTGTRFYKIWQDMIARCCKENNVSYQRYGLLGITVSKRWLKFEKFYIDMKDGYEAHLTLERKNGKKGYCKKNCKWATYQEQSENKKNTIYLTIDGKTKTLMDWSRITGVPPRLIRFRINTLKWSDHKMAATKPSIRKVTATL